MILCARALVWRPTPKPSRRRHPIRLARTCAALAIAHGVLGDPLELTLTGDWTLSAVLRDGSATRHAVIEVPPATLLTVNAELHDALPLFNPQAGGWQKGAQLRALRAQETTTPFLLDPESLELRAGPGATAEVWRAGEDYAADLIWGTVGRTATGSIREGQPVFARYRYAPLRLDAIVLSRAGQIELRLGEPRAAAPTLPALAAGERHLGSVWVPGRLARLTSQHLFPVFETAYPEPPGSPHNYREKVLGAKADLIVSEFVNDAWLNPAQVEEQYGRLLADFRQQGAEWILLTPHYVRPDWMGLDRERDIDDDPRPYVAGLRQFAVRHGVALADAARRYGRLWRQGLPYTTLMLNSINHPDARGLAIFADALLELFPAPGAGL